MPIPRTYNSTVNAEVSLPTRVAPPRPFRPNVSRSSWRCGPAGRSGSQQRGKAESSVGSKRRVLVIDDESSMRMLCRINLAAAGIDVLEADNGETGLELGRREQPDLILLDVMMPGIDGWEVARRLASDPATREIPVVFLTARAGDDDRRVGEATGGVGYVVKPFDPVGIGHVVEDVLRRIERGEREALRRQIVHPPRDEA